MGVDYSWLLSKCRPEDIILGQPNGLFVDRALEAQGACKMRLSMLDDIAYITRDYDDEEFAWATGGLDRRVLGAEVPCPEYRIVSRAHDAVLRHRVITNAAAQAIYDELGELVR